MARTDEVADLVGDGVAGGGTLVVHDGEGFLGIGIDTRGQATTLGIVDNQDGHVGAMLVAQTMDLLHVAVALVGEAPDVIEVRALLDVVGLIGVHEPQLDVAEIARAERLVGLLDGEVDQLALDVGVVGRRLLGVGDDHVDDDVVRSGLRGLGLGAGLVFGRPGRLLLLLAFVALQSSSAGACPSSRAA